MADLTRPNTLASHTFACIICTHVLHTLAHTEIDRFIAELARLLAPGGVLLVAVPISPIYAGAEELSRLTPEGLFVAVAKAFRPDAMTRRAYGNSLTAASHIRGLYAYELTPAELAYHDPDFAFEICARAVKSRD